MILSFALLVAGLVVLVFAGDFIVRGSVATALKLGMSQILASVLIVGFGTSAPEMLVAIEATLAGTPGMAMGNIVGSNIANVLLVLGAPALLMALKTSGMGLRRSVIFTAVATLAWLVVTPVMGLTPVVGIAFLVILAIYIVTSLLIPAVSDPDELVADEVRIDPPGWAKTALFIALGVVGLPLGSHLAITGAIDIADEFNVSGELVGLTLLAVGTSLPEFSAAMAAALRKRSDVVMGNVAGSMMFNILAAGGIIALFGPIALPPIFGIFDHWFMGATMALVLVYVLMRRSIGWFTGALMLAAYVFYLFGLHHFYVESQAWSDLWS